MRKLIISLLIVISVLLIPKPALAIYDPLEVPNNKFGIHIADPVDLADAANLVNSEGGDWGYVTFVIQKTERDKNRWQKVMNEARRLHLIPIVRIATRGLDGVWEKPSIDEIDGWVSFLNSLNWVIENRYVVIGNEPNHAKEWGGEINPEEYATYLKRFSERLKRESPDFFVLPAGFDASAPNSKETLDEVAYLQRMQGAEPDVFAKIDGWTSHSYPNPGFIGLADGTGRGTVRTFEWELSVLKSLGVDKNLAVFITETGWTHDKNGGDKKLVKVETVGERFRSVFENAWNRKNVVAVTPFILSYNQEPFSEFSWKDANGNFYGFYNDVQKIKKEKGEPIQKTSGEILALLVSPLQLSGQEFSGLGLLENTGQSIWNSQTISLKETSADGFRISYYNFPEVEPFETELATFRGIENISGSHAESVAIFSANSPISAPYSFSVFALSPQKVNLVAIFSRLSNFWRSETGE